MMNVIVTIAAWTKNAHSDTELRLGPGVVNYREHGVEVTYKTGKIRFFPYHLIVEVMQIPLDQEPGK